MGKARRGAFVRGKMLAVAATAAAVVSAVVAVGNCRGTSATKGGGGAAEEATPLMVATARGLVCLVCRRRRLGDVPVNALIHLGGVLFFRGEQQGDVVALHRACPAASDDEDPREESVDRKVILISL